MPSRLNPYLSFKDDAREAMEFYQSVFGGKLDVSTFKEYQASQDPSEDDKVMHARLETESGILIMGADTPKLHGVQPGGTHQHVAERRRRGRTAGLLGQAP